MDIQEIQRLVQYLTAGTNFSRPNIEGMIQTAFADLSALAQRCSQNFKRTEVLEYICQWTLKQTNQPETMIREALERSGKWLDELCAMAER